MNRYKIYIMAVAVNIADRTGKSMISSARKELHVRTVIKKIIMAVTVAVTTIIIFFITSYIRLFQNI